MIEEKRYLLKYLGYECSNGQTIQGDPYFVDKKGEFIDTDYFTIDGYYTMSDKQVLDLLNENEQLKKDIEYLEETIKENEWHWNTIDEDRDVWHYKCNQLEKENERLKSEIMEMINEDDVFYVPKKELDALLNENKQLKKQLDGICQSYSDYYGMNIRNAQWYGFKGDD